MKEHTVYPATAASLSKLAGIQGDDRCVLTIYFPGSFGAGPNAADKLAELPGELLGDEGLTADESEHLRRSLDLWRAAARRLSLPAAPGWLAVVSWLTEDVALMHLPAAVGPVAYLDNSPFLLPAARDLDDYEAYAVVYADHARAAIYLAALGRLTEEGRLRGDIKNHVKKGGWSQQRYERRRDKQIHYYCREIVEKLTRVVEEERLRRIVLAGDRILLGELEKRMSAGMRKLVVCRLAVEGGKEPPEIFRETLSAAEAEERREERWLGDAIRSERAAGRPAVTGPEETLAALKEKRVRRLLIGPMKDVDFRRCRECGAIGLGGAAACPGCGSATYAQSAANEFMDLAFEGGARVEITPDDLVDIGGVGALLRW